MQSPKAAVVDCFRNFRRDEALCVPARDGSRLFTIPPLLQLARAAGSSCCWDYEGLSQCNAVWLAKKACASIRRHGNSSTIPNREQNPHQKIRSSKPLVSIPREKNSATPVRAVAVSASVHPCAPGGPFELLACRRNPSCNNFRHRQHVGKPAGR